MNLRNTLMLRCTAAAILIAGAGCVGPLAYQPVVRYRISPCVEVETFETAGLTLGIRLLDAASPYKQAIMYRESDYVLKSYENDQWADAPRDAVTSALTDAIIATGRFKDVGNAADLRMPDLMLTGQLRKFDEVHTEDPWTAECEIRLELREGFGTAGVWAATLSAREPLKTNDVSALPAAMSGAVAAVVREAANRIAATELPEKPEGEDRK